MTPEQREEAKRYGRISLGFTLADMAVDLVYLALMAFVFARPLDAWLAGFPALAGQHSMLRLLALLCDCRPASIFSCRCRCRSSTASSWSTGSG